MSQVTITRTAITDDDGSGTTGTVINNDWKQEFYGQIDDALTQVVQTKTATYTLDANDDVVKFTTAGCDLDLPAANSVGKRAYEVINAAGSGDVTIDPNGAETIDGAGSLVLGPGEAAIIRSDGSNWFSVATNVATSNPAGTLNCALTRSSAQSISHNTFTAVTFDTEEFDTGGLHSTVSNTSRITIPSGGDGVWLFAANGLWDVNGTGARYLFFYKNGSAVTGVPVPGNGTYYTSNSLTAMLSLVAGDYIEVYVFQDSGGALNFGSNGATKARFQAMRVS